MTATASRFPMHQVPTAIRNDTLSYEVQYAPMGYRVGVCVRLCVPACVAKLLIRPYRQSVQEIAKSPIHIVSD